MERIKDYIFLVIPKNENILEEIGTSFGVKRSYSKNHQHYYRLFLENYPFIHENLNLFSDWERSMEVLARDGNLVVVNSAVEIEEEKDRLYLIYLPTFPSKYQLIELENILNQLENIDFDVSVYGLDEELFNTFRINNEFDAREFLKNYIYAHKKRLSDSHTCFYQHSEESKKIYTKV